MSEHRRAAEMGLWERGACPPKMREPTGAAAGCVHRAGSGPGLSALTAFWSQTWLYFKLPVVFLCAHVSVSRPRCDSCLHPTQWCTIREAVGFSRGWDSQRPSEPQSAKKSHKMRKSCPVIHCLQWNLFFLKKKETALTCKNALNFTLLYF